MKESDVADGHLVQTTSVYLLSTVFDIADWLPYRASGVETTTSVAGDR